jgi:hypothetical protein
MFTAVTGLTGRDDIWRSITATLGKGREVLLRQFMRFLVTGFAVWRAVHTTIAIRRLDLFPLGRCQVINGCISLAGAPRGRVANDTFRVLCAPFLMFGTQVLGIFTVIRALLCGNGFCVLGIIRPGARILSLAHQSIALSGFKTVRLSMFLTCSLGRCSHSLRIFCFVTPYSRTGSFKAGSNGFVAMVGQQLFPLLDPFTYPSLAYDQKRISRWVIRQKQSLLFPSFCSKLSLIGTVIVGVFEWHLWTFYQKVYLGEGVARPVVSRTPVATGATPIEAHSIPYFIGI